LPIAAKRLEEGSQTCNVWNQEVKLSRVGDAADVLALFQSAKLAAFDQTLHVWLPSECAFGAKSEFLNPL